MNEDIDLSFRPRSYFGPRPLEEHLLASIKNDVMRRTLSRLGASDDDGLRAYLAEAALDESTPKSLESVHPMFMGGNYLPETGTGEVEIARISLESTTHDVTCVYACAEAGEIHYRVVDEYDGDTLCGPVEARTKLPMTLGEFADFFLGAWPLLDVLDMNFEGDRAMALAFFVAESAFYPDFDGLCRARVCERFPEPESEWADGDRCPVCDHFNSPPAEDTCEHLCAFVWDGDAEIYAPARMLAEAYERLVDLAGEDQYSVQVDRILEQHTARSDALATLARGAREGQRFDMVLQGIAHVEAGAGWSTEGMSGGSGYNLYTASPERLLCLAMECRAAVTACGSGDDATRDTLAP